MGKNAIGAHKLFSDLRERTPPIYTMKLLVVAALLASSASAFVSQSPLSSSTMSKSALSVTVGSKFEKEIGVQAPVRRCWLLLLLLLLYGGLVEWPM
jgi:hypothetical protein